MTHLRLTENCNAIRNNVCEDKNYYMESPCCKGLTLVNFIQEYSQKVSSFRFVPHIMSGILLTLWEVFRLHLDLPQLCRSQSAHNMQKFEVRSRSNSFSNLGDFISPFNPVFYSHFKNINFFEIRQKLTFLLCFSMELFSLRKNSFFFWK